MIQYAKFLSTVFLFLIFTNTANAAAAAAAAARVPDSDGVSALTSVVVPPPVPLAAAAADDSLRITSQTHVDALMAGLALRFKPRTVDTMAATLAQALSLAAAFTGGSPPRATVPSSSSVEDLCEVISFPDVPAPQLVQTLNAHRALVRQWAAETIPVPVDGGATIRVRSPINPDASIRSIIDSLHDIIFLALTNLGFLDARLEGDATYVLPGIDLKDFRGGAHLAEDATERMTIPVNVGPPSMQTINSAVGPITVPVFATRDVIVEVLTVNPLKKHMAELSKDLKFLNPDASLLANMQALWAAFKEVAQQYATERLRLKASNKMEGAAVASGSSGGKETSTSPASPSRVSAAGGAGATKKPLGLAEECRGRLIDQLVDFDKLKSEPVPVDEADPRAAVKNSWGRLKELPLTWDRAQPILMNPKNDIHGTFMQLYNSMCRLLDELVALHVMQKEKSWEVRSKVKLSDYFDFDEIKAKVEGTAGDTKDTSMADLEKSLNPVIADLSRDMPILDSARNVESNMESIYKALGLLLDRYERAYERYEAELKRSGIAFHTSPGVESMTPSEDAYWAFV